jgi:hypothetical protein
VVSDVEYTCIVICEVLFLLHWFRQRLLESVDRELLLCDDFHRFVVGAVVVHFVNITAIYIGTHEVREKKTPQPMIEEKSNGAIMLY